MIFGGILDILDQRSHNQQQSIILHQSLDSSLQSSQQQQAVQHAPNIISNISILSLAYILKATESSNGGPFENNKKNDNINSDYKCIRFTTAKTKSIFETIGLDNFYFELIMYTMVWALFVLYFGLSNN